VILRPLEITAHPNTDGAERAKNIRSALARGLPVADRLWPAHARPLAIVGGGPSLKRCLADLVCRDWEVWALNGAHDWLIGHGFTPDAMILLDARPENVAFVGSPQREVEYLIASQCDPSVFDALSGYDITLWHSGTDETADNLLPPGAVTVHGGSTVGLKAMMLAHVLGYRDLHLFGYDSSYESDQGHAYAQPQNDADPTIEIGFDGTMYRAAPWMAHQAAQFPEHVVTLARAGTSVTVYGTGLLPHVAARSSVVSDHVVAAYDLAVAPPTWDFLSFLAAAEAHRRAVGAETMEVVFLPGPKEGFRDDELPPADTASRERMLRHVAMPLARLLPSVTRVGMAARKSFDGRHHVFPFGYHPDTPIPAYGLTELVRHAGSLDLRPSDRAREHVRQQCPDPYVTITLRQAPYWTGRNSDLAEWAKVVAELRRRGWHVVVIPDVDGAGDFSIGDDDAAHDPDIRLALYERAAMNLGVNNGPMSLCYLTKAPYLVFRMLDPTGEYPCGAEFMAQHGLPEGGQFCDTSPFRRLVWALDDAETAMQFFDEAMASLLPPGSPASMAPAR